MDYLREHVQMTLGTVLPDEAWHILLRSLVREQMATGHLTPERVVAVAADDPDVRAAWRRSMERGLVA